MKNVKPEIADKLVAMLEKLKKIVDIDERIYKLDGEIDLIRRGGKGHRGDFSEIERLMMFSNRYDKKKDLVEQRKRLKMSLTADIKRWKPTG